jgi:hypothetical protein
VALHEPRERRQSGCGADRGQDRYRGAADTGWISALRRIFPLIGFVVIWTFMTRGRARCAT